MFCRCFLIFFLLSLLAPSAHAGEFVRLTTGEWPPYISRDLRHNGLISRIVTQAFALEDIEVEYGFYPWKRAMDLAKTADWDGSSVWLWTEERSRDFLYSDPIIDSQEVFFHLRGANFDWEGYSDLARYEIGVTLGYSYGEEFDRQVKEGRVRVQKVATDELNFNKLLMGRIDAFVCNIEIGYFLLRAKFGPGTADLITHHPKFVTTGVPLHVIISRNNERGPDCLEAFNRGLARLKESGMYDMFVLESRRGEYVK